MAMSKAQKNLFVTNRVYLINSIEPNEELCAHLRAGNHMTESMQEQIMIEPTTKRRVGKLLDMLTRRSAKAFDAFVYALVMTDQEHVAEKLDLNKTAELVRRRDAERGVHNHTVAQASSSGTSSHSAMVPSGSPVTTTSSAGPMLSSQMNTQPCQPAQSSTAPAAGCEPEPITSAGIDLQSGCSTHVASIPAAQPSSLPHVQAMDLSLTDDVEDVIDALVATDEDISLVQGLSSQQTSLHQYPDLVIKKGYAVIIQNMKYKGNELCSPISNVVVSEFFKRCGFENNTETWQDLREQDLKARIRELRNSDKLKSCEAFVLFFMGFGDDGGQIFGTDGQPVSIKTDILQNFNTDNCPALRGKPKIFCFQMANPVTSGAVPMSVDNVDADLGQQLSKAAELWSDMIIFSFVMPTTLGPESFDHSNYMHRAIIRVAYKFAHELPLYDILNKVKIILECQKVTTEIGSAGPNTGLYRSSDIRPVYLQLANS